jgi:predicted RNase H-like HicB family nuclease
MSTHYIAVLEDAGPDFSIGVWFPDLPGCFSAGDTMEQAIANAPEAANLWLETLDPGRSWPSARTLTELRADPKFEKELKDYGDNVVFLVVQVVNPMKLAAE